MHENCDFVVPVNILTPFARAPFSWATRHTTVCFDLIKCSNGNLVEDYLISSPPNLC